jgi:peptidoglycan/LPS O-acetylase OafA/YrhL
MMVKASRATFEFADGLRAVAAVAVALYHTYTFTGASGENRNLPSPFKLLQVGDYAVSVFIVLSGFVLMLPVVQTRNLELRGGAAQFLRRRSRRILPPYYVVIVGYFAVIMLVPGLNEPTGTAWDSKVPVTFLGALSHLLMLHNLHPGWAYQIDGPAWSVATEWQIYFLMPLVLLPVWRRLGVGWTVGLAVAAGWIIHLVLPQVDVAHFWFIGLFAMGMGAAWLVHRSDMNMPGAVPFAALTVVFAVIAVNSEAAQRFAWLSETAVGASIAVFLVWMSRRSLSRNKTWVHRILESRLLVWIGMWSYSLYLVHSPVLGIANVALAPVQMPLIVRFTVLAVVVLPLAGALSYGFHRLVERPFMTSHQRQIQVKEPLTEKART